MKLKNEFIDGLLKSFLEEDRADKDITTSNLGIKYEKSKAFIKSRQEAVISGLPILERLFSSYSPGSELNKLAEDGDKVSEDAIIVEIEANPSDILRFERTSLNILAHLSGIATLTAEYVGRIKDINPLCRILDTRKTIPGLRILEKYAVRCGGGFNHRMDLSDQVLIKENHIFLSGMDIPSAVSSIREKITPSTLIEVEVENISELNQALTTYVDIVLLDNFSTVMTKEAVAIIRSSGKKIEIESSGGIDLTTVASYASCGVDRISVGSITSSAKAADFSLLFRNDKNK